MSKVTGTIRSEKGFYIGDLCYALNDAIYDEVWGGAGYQDGIYEDPASGFKFAVAGTAYGDGTYEDAYYLRTFDVDAGNLSVVPGELVEDTQGGHYFPGAGEAYFTAEDGVFEISLPGGELITIDTANEAGEEDEEDYYEETEDEDEYED